VPNKNHFLLLILGLVVLGVFIRFGHQPAASLAIDDFVSQAFYLFNKKPARQLPIVVVAIDDYSLRKIQSKWPWPRSFFARALDILDKEQARVVGFDLSFVGEGLTPQDDASFARALRDFSGQVVLAYFLDEEGNPVYSKREFQEAALSGFLNTPADKDGVVRKLRAYLEFDGFSDFSWPLEITSSFGGVAPQIRAGDILFRGKALPLNYHDLTLNANYLFKPPDFKTVSFADLLNRSFPPGIFKDKIVLVASTARITHDIHPTPLGSMPGVFLHANGIMNIWEDKLLRIMPTPGQAAVLLSALIAIAVLTTSLNFLLGLVASSAVLILLFWFTIILKFLGWQLGLGKVVVFSFAFLLAAEIFTYLRFWARLIRIKNQMTKDVLTGLFSLRYFYQRLDLDLKSVFRRARYLKIVILEGFSFSFQGEDFYRLKQAWQDISAGLFAGSNLWARCGEEAVLGATGKDYSQKLKKELEAICREHALKIKVKLGTLKLGPGFNLRQSLPFLLDKVKASSEDIVVFSQADRPSGTTAHPRSDDLLSSLHLDAEEKNRSLLSTIEQLKQEEAKNKQAYFQLVSSLVSALESKDAYTKGHSQRVGDYACLLAEKLKLSEEEIERIRKAALLHDLGKIGIPDGILHKRGSLNDDEFAVIKEHEVTSVRILEPIEEFRSIMPYILHHHERFDGTGYPHGLAGEMIPRGARIIAIADVFDALITGRDYKKAFPIKDAVAELQRCKGSQFDPVLVDAFVEALREARMAG
jgi:HD-GYP domain-containing protein (c-di-GMP phosphodiesterase class II)/CHASE2 domain-containing sensor protein